MYKKRYVKKNQNLAQIYLFIYFAVKKKIE